LPAASSRSRYSRVTLSFRLNAPLSTEPLVQNQRLISNSVSLGAHSNRDLAHDHPPAIIDYLRIYSFLIDHLDIALRPSYSGRAQTPDFVVALPGEIPERAFVEGVVSHGCKEVSSN